MRNISAIVRGLLLCVLSPLRWHEPMGIDPGGNGVEGIATHLCLRGFGTTGSLHVTSDLIKISKDCNCY